MTREETKKLISVMCMAYPSYKPDDINAAINLWTELTSDIPYSTMSLALKSYIRTNKTDFAPSIGMLMHEASKLNKPYKMSTAEAWGLVRKALRNGAYEPDKEFDSLPFEVQRAVGTPGNLRAMALCSEDWLESTHRRSFEREYERETEKSESIALLPPNLRAAIEAKKPVKEEPVLIEYHIPKEAMRSGVVVNADNISDLLQKRWGSAYQD